MTTCDDENDPGDAQPKRTIGEEAVNALVRERLGSCPYAHCFTKVSWDFADGILTLRGYVPTYYLKQTLNSLLTDIGLVERLSNQVHVVSSTGLSSERLK